MGKESGTQAILGSLEVTIPGQSHCVKMEMNLRVQGRSMKHTVIRNDQVLEERLALLRR